MVDVMGMLEFDIFSMHLVMENLAATAEWSEAKFFCEVPCGLWG